MRRKIHVPSLAALILAIVATGAVLWRLWHRSLVSAGEIQCGNDGYSVQSCMTDFGNYATVVLFVAFPLIGWLTYQAFFSRFK